MNFVVLADHRVKLKESEKRDKCENLAKQKTEEKNPKQNKQKNMGCKNDCDINRNWCVWYYDKRIDTGTIGTGNGMISGDHPNFSIVETPIILRSVLET